ncbi:MAG: hypothetical protein U0Y10_04505 [Spirosomataceae bacterium]
MSQISERSNIISIDETPTVSAIHASMVNLSEMSSYQPLSMALPDIQSMCPQHILSALNATHSGLHFTTASTTVCSPNTLRAAFGSTFSPTIKKLEHHGLSTLDAKKASLISSISRMDFKVADQRMVKSGIKAVLSARDEKTLNTGIKAVMHQLEVAHTKVFTANLAKACAKASVAVGFKQVEIKQVAGKLEVIATNNIGQRLNSEISVDANTNQVNANTETIGITDGSCNAIITSFNDELKKMGIKIGSEKTTFTGGACQMPYSKMIDQQDKEALRKNKEQARRIKMNTPHKQKI